MNSYQDVSVTEKRRALKAFTLVELIIVIAIIGILMSMVSLFLPGFIRDANLESYNKSAQMAYTGMQNCLIDWEIKQDRSCLDADALGTKSYTTKELTYASLEFVIKDGKLFSQILINSYYDDLITNQSTFIVSPTGSDDEKKVFKKLGVAITENFGEMISGRFLVYINYSEFVVDSVVYSPDYNVTPQYDFLQWAKDSPSKVKIFGGCGSNDDQLAFYKNDKKTTCGFYPIAENTADYIKFNTTT